MQEKLDLTNYDEVAAAIESRQIEIKRLQKEVAEIEELHVKAICNAAVDGSRVYLLKSVHHWFELSYAHYLVIPRSVLQAMPDEWQDRFVGCLEELDDMIDWRPKNACYYVDLHQLDDSGERGKKIRDPFLPYRHPDSTPWKDKGVE